MTDVKFKFVNTGIYSVPEAARLTRVSAGRIRRWLRGYRFRSHNKEYQSKPLWQGQFEPIDNSFALGFLDLMEIRFVDAFVKAGVTWAMIRGACETGREMFGDPHPFCTNQFVTDGRDIFVELHRTTGERSLLEIVNRQHVFTQIIKPFLKELEFADGKQLLRWWPLGVKRFVVLDPARSFGRPIVARQGVPTEVLAKAAVASGSVSEVAGWYDVAEEEIGDAVEYEQKLAA
jgi:uncharacterized protein (DUF433 family)